MVDRECIKKVENISWRIYASSVAELVNTVLNIDKLVEDPEFNLSKVISCVYREINIVQYFIGDEFPMIVGLFDKANISINQIIDALEKGKIEDIKELILGTSLKEMARREEIDPRTKRPVTITPLSEITIPALKKFLEKL